MTTALDQLIARIHKGLAACYDDMYGVPSNWPDGLGHVSGGGETAPPRPNFETAYRYRRAEWSILTAVNIARRRTDGIRLELETRRESHWVALAGLVVKLADYELTEDVLEQLRAAERVLRPWWRTPKQPQRCSMEGCTRNVRRGRKSGKCWKCSETRRYVKTA